MNGLREGDANLKDDTPSKDQCHVSTQWILREGDEFNKVEYWELYNGSSFRFSQRLLHCRRRRRRRRS